MNKFLSHHQIIPLNPWSYQEKSRKLLPTHPKPLTSASSSLPSNDHVTILGAVENLVNMLKSMSARLPTISFPLQSPCPPCQPPINVSMTRLRLLLSHHPTATHHPPLRRTREQQYLTSRLHEAHHTISHNRHFVLSYCLPMSFCLVTRGTHPLIILDPPA